MCGIFCQLYPENSHNISGVPESVLRYLRNRGPDHVGCHALKTESENGISAVFVSTVLHLRGQFTREQPAIDNDGNILCWNGEVFGSVRDSEQNNELDSDTEFVLRELQDCHGNAERIHNCMLNINGPFAFVYYSAEENALFFGRDYLGRRSLTWSCKDGTPETFCLCSIVPPEHLSDGYAFGEVSQHGLYVLRKCDGAVKIEFRSWGRWPSVMQLETSSLPSETISIAHFSLDFIPSPGTDEVPTWEAGSQLPVWSTEVFAGVEDCFRRTLEDKLWRSLIGLLEQKLCKSIESRVLKAVHFCKNCSMQCDHCNFAVLFSGGLDSMLLAFLLDRFVPKNQPIDLLNVSFFVASNGSQEAPDRKTGLRGLSLLRDIGPERTWNFVEIDIEKTEADEMRKNHLWRLLIPQSSVLDCSIATALWFAARGVGRISETGTSYECPARILFSGLGADELFGGYSRHRARFEKSGCSLDALQKELFEDIHRIGTRNCGRDDRVLSDHGREVRYPFLDEDFVNFVVRLPTEIKCNLRLARGTGDKFLLRLLAFSLGLHSIASLEKRALQFGSRIAKMDGTKSGDDASDFLSRGVAK